MEQGTLGEYRSTYAETAEDYYRVRLVWLVRVESDYNLPAASREEAEKMAREYLSAELPFSKCEVIEEITHLL